MREPPAASNKPRQESPQYRTAATPVMPKLPQRSARCVRRCGKNHTCWTCADRRSTMLLRVCCLDTSIRSQAIYLVGVLLRTNKLHQQSPLFPRPRCAQLGRARGGRRGVRARLRARAAPRTSVRLSGHLTVGVTCRRSLRLRTSFFTPLFCCRGCWSPLLHFLLQPHTQCRHRCLRPSDALPPPLGVRCTFHTPSPCSHDAGRLRVPFLFWSPRGWHLLLLLLDCFFVLRHPFPPNPLHPLPHGQRRPAAGSQDQQQPGRLCSGRRIGCR